MYNVFFSTIICYSVAANVTLKCLIVTHNVLILQIIFHVPLEKTSRDKKMELDDLFASMSSFNLWGKRER